MLKCLDVGGGAVSNTTDHSLADISLRWMVRQVVLSQCGITFDSAALLRANMPDSIFRGVGFALCAPLSHKRSRSPGLVPHSEGSNSKEHHSLDELRNPSVHEGQSPNYLEVPSTPLAIDSDPFASPKSKARAVAIEEIQIKVDASGHQRDTSDGGDSTLTDIDELQPIHDQLKILPVWWILELVPLTWNCQDAEGNWHQKFGYVFLQ